MKKSIKVSYNITNCEKSINADYLNEILPDEIEIAVDDTSVEVDAININVYVRDLSSEYKPYGTWKTKVEIHFNGKKRVYNYTHHSEELHTCIKTFYNQNWFSEEEEEEEAVNNCQAAFGNVIDHYGEYGGYIYSEIYNIVDSIINPE